MSKETKSEEFLSPDATLKPIDPDISTVDAPEPDVLAAFLLQEQTDQFIREHSAKQ